MIGAPETRLAMSKRIIILHTAAEEAPKPAAVEATGPWAPGQERRADQRRSGLPRRLTPDRRRRRATRGPGDRRDSLRRTVSDRRRQRDRRFGLDPTLYDRLVELDL
jgi:hypothetical protein